MGICFLIFCQVDGNYRSVRSVTHWSGFRLKDRTQHHNSSSYQPCLQPVDLATKSNPCLQNEEHKQDLERMQLKICDKLQTND
jgi:hypothetical protein